MEARQRAAGVAVLVSTGAMAPVGVQLGVHCQQPDQNCQLLATDNAYNSTGGLGYLSADDFTAAANGSITDLCWHGVYLEASRVERLELGTDDGIHDRQLFERVGTRWQTRTLVP